MRINVQLHSTKCKSWQKLDKNNLKMVLPDKSVNPYTQKCALFYQTEMSGQLAFRELWNSQPFPVSFLPVCRSMASAGDKSRISPDIFKNKEMEIQGDFSMSDNSINFLLRHSLLFIFILCRQYIIFFLFNWIFIDRKCSSRCDYNGSKP